MEMSDVKKIIEFIKNYYKENSFAKGAIIGMSGGKDSLVAAKLCIEALGKEKVLGVIMPNGKMKDQSDAIRTCELLQIKYVVLNIENTYNTLIDDCKKVLNSLGKEISSVSTINTAPRIRMTTLYAIGSSLDYLVVNTSNLSEACVGYTTKWGDNVGDFAPLANFTKTEVCEIGLLLGLPNDLVNKTPSDGLSGKSDEDNMGITYENLDKYIRKGIKSDNFERIEKLNKNSYHKRKGVIKYDNGFKNYLEDNK